MRPVLVVLKEPEASAFDFAALAAQGLPVRCAASVAEALPLAASAEVIITLGPHLGDEARRLFEAAKALRWVQLISTGTDNVAEHLAGRDVTLTNTRGLHGRQMSEAALGAMLALARQSPRAARNQAAAKWERFASSLLAGKTVGILGVGAIAETLAPLCRALGMRVVGISGSPRPVGGFDEMRSRDDLAAAVGDLDHLILLLPHSAQSHGLIGAAAFAAMKPSAFLINLARGGIVDEAALVAALDAGEIAGAALDVFETEPLPAASPLWRHPQIIVTPHIGGLHTGYPAEVMALIEGNLRRYAEQGPAALMNRVELPQRLADAAE